jgi:hypothetical protein
MVIASPTTPVTSVDLRRQFVTDIEPAAEPTENPSTSASEMVPPAAAAAASTTGGGVTFDFVFNNVTYTAQIYAPDSHSQYGFTITQGNTTIASLIYLDDNDWKISAGLPSALQVDTNLKINTLSVDISKGAVTPLS